MLCISLLWQGKNLQQYLNMPMSVQKDEKIKQMELNNFPTPFNMESADVLHVLKLEIIQLQSNN